MTPFTRDPLLFCLWMFYCCCCCPFSILSERELCAALAAHWRRASDHYYNSSALKKFERSGFILCKLPSTSQTDIARQSKKRKRKIKELAPPATEWHQRTEKVENRKQISQLFVIFTRESTFIKSSVVAVYFFIITL